MTAEARKNSRRLRRSILIDPFWRDIVLAVPPTLVGAAALIAALRNGKKADAVASEVKEVKATAQETKVMATDAVARADILRDETTQFHDFVLRSNIFTEDQIREMTKKRRESGFGPLDP
jgi:hypothetical protein